MQLYNRKHNVFVIRHCGRFFNQAGTLESRNFKLKEIVGIVSNETNLGYTEQKDGQYFDTPFLETLDWTGEWIGLFYDDASKTGLFSADFFGFGQIFYSILHHQDERILVVGDSFRGVNNAVKKIVGTTGINWHIAMPHLTSGTNIFSTRYSFETFSQDIQVLHEDQVLLFNQQGISILSKPVPNYLTSLSYDELLSKGINKAINMIGSAVKLGLVNELSLSGGKDSRAVLGLIMASGYGQEVSLYTAPSSGVAAGASREILDKDFSLACRLSEYFGLNWNTNGDFDEYRINFDEAINHWQNLRANSTFDLRPQLSQIVGKKEVRFTGIGGELFRSYIGIGYKEGFPQWWNNCGKTKQSIRQDLASLFRALCPTTDIHPALYQKSLSAFVDAMDFGQGEDVIHQLDANYSKYRSRCHSGVAHTHYSQGALLSYPLCLPEFVYASKQLSRYDQEQDKTLFDILEYTIPDLNKLEYASPPWDSSFKTKGVDVWSEVSGAKMAQTYTELLNARKKPIQDRGLKPFNFITESRNRLYQNMDKLRDFAIDNQLDFFEGVNGRIARLQQRSEQHLFSMVSKTETLLDIIENKDIHIQFAELDLLKNEFRLDNQLNSKFTPYQLTNLDLSKMPTFSDVCEQIDMSDFKFSGEIDDENRYVNIEFENIKDNCEIACYLYEDGKKIDQLWYQKCSTMQFFVPNLDMSKRYRITVFYKWDNETHAQKTESLTLN